MLKHRGQHLAEMTAWGVSNKRTTPTRDILSTLYISTGSDHQHALTEASLKVISLIRENCQGTHQSWNKKDVTGSLQILFATESVANKGFAVAPKHLFFSDSVNNLPLFHYYTWPDGSPLHPWLHQSCQTLTIDAPKGTAYWKSQPHHVCIEESLPRSLQHGHIFPLRTLQCHQVSHAKQFSLTSFHTQRRH